MRSAHKLRSSNWSTGGNDSISLSGLPSGAIGNMVPYLTKIELVCVIASTVGSGGQAVTALQWRNLLASFTCNVPGGPWGPVNLSGEQMEVMRYFQSGEPIPYGSDTAGDSAAANSAGAITRVVRHAYSFESLSSPDAPWDFCPPAAAFKDGSLQMTYSATITNTSANTITFQPIVHIIWRNEAQSVSRVRTIAKALVGKNETIPEGGLLLRLVAHDTVTDAVAADFTAFRLWKDGYQILDVTNPLDLRANEYSEDAKVSNARIQETFDSPIGGNFVRGINIYPMEGARAKLGDLPVGDTWKYDFDGNPTLLSWEVIYTIAYRQDDQHVRTVLGSCGCGDDLIGKTEGGKPVPPARVLVPRGPNGSILNSSRLKGFTPFTAVPRTSPLASIASRLGMTK